MMQNPLPTGDLILIWNSRPFVGLKWLNSVSIQINQTDWQCVMKQLEDNPGQEIFRFSEMWSLSISNNSFKLLKRTATSFLPEVFYKATGDTADKLIKQFKDFNIH